MTDSLNKISRYTEEKTAARSAESCWDLMILFEPGIGLYTFVGLGIYFQMALSKRPFFFSIFEEGCFELATFLVCL